jgi:hypothetical protein
LSITDSITKKAAASFKTGHCLNWPALPFDFPTGSF